MRLTMKEKQVVTKALSERYKQASKKEKGQILDEFIATTGYNRWYAVGLLRRYGKAIKVGRHLKLVADLKRPEKRCRKRTYDESVVEPLRKIWAILDGLCGKRLRAILPEVIPVLEAHS